MACVHSRAALAEAAVAVVVVAELAARAPPVTGARVAARVAAAERVVGGERRERERREHRLTHLDCGRILELTDTASELAGRSAVAGRGDGAGGSREMPRAGPWPGGVGPHTTTPGSRHPRTPARAS